MLLTAPRTLAAASVTSICMPLLPHASWSEDAIHDLTYDRLLLSFKEPVVQQAYLEDRARRYRPVRNKVHAGVCAYLAIFAGNAAWVHDFRSLFVVFAIFFAAANASICCVSVCTNFFVSHNRLSQLSRFIALTMLACNVLWVAGGRLQEREQQQSVVFAVTSPVVLTLFNITSRTPYLHNLACLVAMSAISTVGVALREPQVLLVFEVVATFVLLAVIAYEVEHVSLQDYTTMQTMDTLIRRPSDLGTRAIRGESALEAHTAQATFTLAELIMSSLASAVNENTGRETTRQSTKAQDSRGQDEKLVLATAAAGFSCGSGALAQAQKIAHASATAEDDEKRGSRLSPFQPLSGEHVPQVATPSTSLSTSEGGTVRNYLSETARFHRLLRIHELSVAMVHYLRAVRGGQVAGTERVTFSLYELCEKLISLLELCDGHRQTVYNEVPPALMLTGSKSQLQSILLLLLFDAVQDQHAFVNIYAKQTSTDGHTWRVGVQSLRAGSPAQHFSAALKEMDHQSELLPVIKIMTKAVLHSNLTCERVASGTIRGYKRHFGLSSTFLSYTSSVSVPPAQGAGSVFPSLLTRSWIVIEGENLRQMSNIKQCLTQLGVTWTTCSADMLINQTRTTQAALVPVTLIQHPKYRATIENYANRSDQAIVVVMTDSQSAVDALALLDDFPMSGLLYENCPVKDVAEIVRTVTHQREAVHSSTATATGQPATLSPTTNSALTDGDQFEFAAQPGLSSSRHVSTESAAVEPGVSQKAEASQHPAPGKTNIFFSNQSPAAPLSKPRTKVLPAPPKLFGEGSISSMIVSVVQTSTSTSAAPTAGAAGANSNSPWTFYAPSIDGDVDLDEAQYLALRKILVDSHGSESTADAYILESLSAMQSMIAALDDMLLSGNLVGLHGHAHQLIGKASHLGAVRLSQVLRATTALVAEVLRSCSSDSISGELVGHRSAMGSQGVVQVPKQSKRELARHIDVIQSRFATFVNRLTQRFQLEIPTATLLHTGQSPSPS